MRKVSVSIFSKYSNFKGANKKFYLYRAMKAFERP
jgi:hypothetical protein